MADERPLALHVTDIIKRYGDLTAVAGVSFEVKEGEIFGLLGPNGAGKTTTLEIVEGLRRPDSGQVNVLGLDAVQNPRAVRGAIGVQLQEAGFFHKTTVRETLRMFGSFYRSAADSDALLARINLTEKRNALVESLSGGQKQRLAIALALINNPKLVFLDEPTTGLDPQARRNTWDVIAAIRAEGRTVVLTTHYMEEAETLCDRLAIMDHGRIIASGTPGDLIQRHAKGARITVEFAGEHDGAAAVGWEPPAGIDQFERRPGGLSLRAERPEQVVPALLGRLEHDGVALSNLRIATPTLEDVFLNLTGKQLRD